MAYHKVSIKIASLFDTVRTETIPPSSVSIVHSESLQAEMQTYVDEGQSLVSQTARDSVLTYHRGAI